MLNHDSQIQGRVVTIRTRPKLYSQQVRKHTPIQPGMMVRRSMELMKSSQSHSRNVNGLLNQSLPSIDLSKRQHYIKIPLSSTSYQGFNITTKKHQYKERNYQSVSNTRKYAATPIIEFHNQSQLQNKSVITQQSFYGCSTASTVLQDKEFYGFRDNSLTKALRLQRLKDQQIRLLKSKIETVKKEQQDTIMRQQIVSRIRSLRVRSHFNTFSILKNDVATLERDIQQQIFEDKLFAAAVKIQAYYRKVLMRKKYQLFQDYRNKCARQIQTVWKKHKFYRLIRTLQLLRKKQSAILIQRHLKGYIARKNTIDRLYSQKLANNLRYFNELRQKITEDAQIKIRYYYLKYGKEKAYKQSMRLREIQMMEKKPSFKKSDRALVNRQVQGLSKQSINKEQQETNKLVHSVLAQKSIKPSLDPTQKKKTLPFSQLLPKYDEDKAGSQQQPEFLIIQKQFMNNQSIVRQSSDLKMQEGRKVLGHSPMKINEHSQAFDAYLNKDTK